MCSVNHVYKLEWLQDIKFFFQLWDLRRGKKAIMEEEAFHDYISDIAVDDRHRLMFAVSGDGTMNSYNVRQRKLIVKSKREKTDLLSAQVMKVSNAQAIQIFVILAVLNRSV